MSKTGHAVRRMAVVSLFLGFGSLLSPAVNQASNGMNLIGHDPRTIALGGAGVAVTADAAAMNLNPAGIARLEAGQIEGGATLMSPDVRHEDSRGGKANDGLERPPSPYVAYAQPAGAWAWGVGVFQQGGLGVRYDDLHTPFNTTDGLKTRIAHQKVTPAVAWRVTEALRIGASLNLSQARADLALFPETSVNMGGNRFTGIDIEGMEAWGTGGSAGVQYQAGDWSLGATYTSRTDLNLDGGKATVNMTALGLGKVSYDARLEGFAWPRQATLGAGYQWSSRLLFAADYGWINWSDTHEKLKIVMTGPGRSGAPAKVTMPMALNWRDQYVVKAGVSFQATESLTARLGVNHGRRPMRDQDVRAQFPAIAERHYTGGLGWRAGAWNLAAALEHVPEVSVVNNNSDRAVNITGAGSRTTLTQNAFTLSIGRGL